MKKHYFYNKAEFKQRVLSFYSYGNETIILKMKWVTEETLIFKNRWKISLSYDAYVRQLKILWKKLK